MKDYQDRLESLVKQAAECDLIAQLTPDKLKAERFKKLAAQYRAMADDMYEAIASLSSKLGKT